MSGSKSKKAKKKRNTAGSAGGRANKGAHAGGRSAGNYIVAEYGNVLSEAEALSLFPAGYRPEAGKHLSARELSYAAMLDKNNFVWAACRLRLSQNDIAARQGFIRCEYRVCPATEHNSAFASWRISMRATPGHQRRVRAFLRDPAPVLERWRREDAGGKLFRVADEGSAQAHAQLGSERKTGHTC